ncbi:MAG: hypothetical protein EZS28_001006 [Streblomastix strix]|uniref:Uncharacterized protein n=1 Tax=Streblomastix strix TaxID=222440 RepID=A0A5J4X8S4_9EUKA|nr:MAG: hypothetical protein EZS28_001006 [Streblomastix strix]
MQHLEFCPGKHVNKCNELKNLHELVVQLNSKDSSVILDVLETIIHEIEYIPIEYCHEEQFSELLDGLETLLGDIQSKLAEKAISVIEILWEKRFTMIISERTKLLSIFKEKYLGKIMKEAILNLYTQASVKERIAFSIFYVTIDGVYDACYIPILDMIQSKLNVEEEYQFQHPSDENHKSKWYKYGVSNLEVSITAFSFYAMISDKFAKEIAKKDGINIGL